MTPRELIRHAKEKGLEAVALTDHDVIDGLDDALYEGEKLGIEVVPGVELSVRSETETHILGYYIDRHNKHLLTELEEAKRVRMMRNYEYSAKLKNLGFDVTVDEVMELAGSDMLGRTHFAQVMVKKGYVQSIKQAFDEYLANGRPAYSSLQYFSPRDAVKLIKDVGGYAYVAHLNLIRKSLPELREFLSDLKKAGLDGIEGWYTEYTPEQQADYQALAAELGLKLSGGTDFHAHLKPHIAIGVGYGNLCIPYSVLEDIRS